MDSTKRVLNMKQQEFRSAAKQWYRDYQTAKQYNDFSTFVESLKRDGNTPLLESIQDGITGIRTAHNITMEALVKRDRAICEAYETQAEQMTADDKIFAEQEARAKIQAEKERQDNLDDDDEIRTMGNEISEKYINTYDTGNNESDENESNNKEYEHNFGNFSQMRTDAGSEYKGLRKGRASRGHSAQMQEWYAMMLPSVVAVAEKYKGDPDVAENIYSGLRLYTMERVNELYNELTFKDGEAFAPDDYEIDGEHFHEQRPVKNVDAYMRSSIMGPYIKPDGGGKGRYTNAYLSHEARKLGEQYHDIKKKFQSPGVLHQDPVFKTGQAMQIKPEMLTELKTKGDVSKLFNLSGLLATQKGITKKVKKLVKEGKAEAGNADAIVTKNLINQLNEFDDILAPSISPEESKQVMRQELILAGLLNDLNLIRNPNAEDLSDTDEAASFREAAGIDITPKMSEDELVKAIDETKAGLDKMPKLGELVDGMNSMEVDDFIQQWGDVPAKGKLEMLGKIAAGKSIRTSLLPWLSPYSEQGSKIWDKMTLQDYKGMTGSLSGAASLNAPSEGDEGEGDTLEGKLGGTNPSKDFEGSVSRLVEDFVQDIDRINATAVNINEDAMRRLLISKYNIRDEAIIDTMNNGGKLPLDADGKNLLDDEQIITVKKLRKVVEKKMGNAGDAASTKDPIGAQPLSKSQLTLLKLIANEPGEYIKSKTKTGVPEYEVGKLTDELNDLGLIPGPGVTINEDRGTIRRSDIQRAWRQLFDIVDNSTNKFDKYRRLHDMFVNDEDGIDGSINPQEGLGYKVMDAGDISNKEAKYRVDEDKLYGDSAMGIVDERYEDRGIPDEHNARSANYKAPKRTKKKYLKLPNL